MSKVKFSQEKLVLRIIIVILLIYPLAWLYSIVKINGYLYVALFLVLCLLFILHGAFFSKGEPLSEKLQGMFTSSGREFSKQNNSSNSYNHFFETNLNNNSNSIKSLNSNYFNSELGLIGDWSHLRNKNYINPTETLLDKSIHNNDIDLIKLSLQLVNLTNAIKNDTATKNISSLLNHNILSDINNSMAHKMQLSLEDGKSHSIALDVPEGPAVSITTFPESQSYIKAYFDNKFGAYKDSLISRTHFFYEQGYSCYLHLIFSYNPTTQNGHVLCGYGDLISNVFVIPEELR